MPHDQATMHMWLLRALGVSRNMYWVIMRKSLWVIMQLLIYKHLLLF